MFQDESKKFETVEEKKRDENVKGGLRKKKKLKQKR